MTEEKEYNKEMNVEIVSYDKDYLKKIFLSGRNCFGLKEITEKDTPQRMKQFAKKLINLQHLTVIEHVNYSFHVTNVSRSLMYQWTRHRTFSFNCKSQHYCLHSNFDYKELENLTDEKLINEYHDLMKTIDNFYIKLMDNGVPRYIARECLPNSTLTNIYCTVNARGLRNFLEQRLTNKNTPEIQKLSQIILKKVFEITPEIVEDLYEKYVNK